MVAYTILRPTQVIIITQPLCILNRCLCGLSGKRAVTRHHPHSVAFANVNHCQWQTYDCVHCSCIRACAPRWQAASKPRPKRSRLRMRPPRIIGTVRFPVFVLRALLLSSLVQKMARNIVGHSVQLNTSRCSKTNKLTLTLVRRDTSDLLKASNAAFCMSYKSGD